MAMRSARSGRAARLVVVLAAVFALGSCQVLEVVFGSVFPSTVGLAKAQVSLADSISQSDGSAFNLRVVQAGANGYVILLGTSSTTGAIAYVYDLNLSLKATVTGFTSNGVMVDPGNNIIVGTQSLAPGTLAVTAATDSINNAGSGGVDGFYDATNIPDANFGFSGSSLLNFQKYAYPWPAGGTALSATLSTSLGSLTIDSLLDDGNPAGNVTLAVSQPVTNGGNGHSATVYFMTTTKANYTAAALTNLVDSSPHFPNIDTENIGFAQGSIFAYDASAEKFLKINPATGSVQSSYYAGADFSNTRFAYVVSGGAFYGFDTKTRVITKYAAWW